MPEPSLRISSRASDVLQVAALGSMDGGADRLGAALGCRVPPGPPQGARCGGGSMLWVGPCRWWLIGAGRTAASVRALLPAEDYALIDLSPAYRVVPLPAAIAT